ncbi:hypothetical protein D3C87_1651720 [compost metagenome]
MRFLIVIGLLIISNIIMTFAWYWHLKSGNSHFPIWKLILISWSIALFEYAFAVPANHFGAAWNIKPFQLKIIQEVITLLVFTVFAVTYLKQDFNWNYVYSFLFILGAVYFAFKK